MENENKSGGAEANDFSLLTVALLTRKKVSK
jgi:hypothetical protein